MIENTVTANELSDVCSGKKVYVYMNVKDATNTITPESKALFEAEMTKNSQKLGQYVDINIDKFKNTQFYTAVHETLNPASITMEIPVSLLPAEGVERNFYILRNHDGAVEDLGATYDKEAKTLKLSSDKYSDFAIAYKDGEEPKPPVPPEPDPPQPQPDPTPTLDPTPANDVSASGLGTSSSSADNIALGVLAGLIAVIATAGFVVGRCRRKSN